MLGLAVCCFVASGSVACDDEELSPACAEAREHSDLDWIQDQIFTKSCASFRSCHQGAAASAKGLGLDDGASSDSLISQPSQLFPNETFVVPGKPNESYLMVVLGSYDGPLPEAGTMPFRNPILCVEKRDAIERWISQLSQ